MIVINDRNYKMWIDRFMAGETTIEEERTLFAYFSSPTLPPDAEKYRQMFEWYTAISPEAAEPAPQPAEPKPSSFAGLTHRTLMVWVSIAASLVVLFGIGWVVAMTAEHHVEHQRLQQFEGSYAYIDGKKVTDLEFVVSIADQMDREINKRFRKADKSFDKTFKKYASPDATQREKELDKTIEKLSNK